MTATQRFATTPVTVPPRAPTPDALDRTEPSHLWITLGQAAMGIWFVFGFGAAEEGPTTVLGISAILLGGFIALSPRGTFGKLRLPLPLVLFALWYWASYRWTWSPGGWWVHAKAESAEFIIPVLVGSLMPIERITQSFRLAFYALVAWTFIATAKDPAATTTHLDPRGNVALPGWHGSFGHKNDLAFFLLMGLMAVLVFEPRRWLRWASTGVTLALILLARSGTGILAFTLLMCLVGWLQVHRNQPDYLRRWFAALSLFLTVGLVGIMIPLTPILMKLGGKDPTISGRTEIWKASISALWPHKWTGFGPGGVWDNQASEPTKGIVDSIGFIVFHAHNGPLELAMRLGLIGLALGLLMAVAAGQHGWWLQRARDDVGRWIVALLILLTITWFSENTMTGEWLGLLAMMSIVARRRRDDLSRRPVVDSWPVRPRVL